uniref:Putative secreted protein n=1 Tax=Anopheles darlingi TaxID=43151 RepID=A0A2M4DDJ9_ANODA
MLSANRTRVGPVCLSVGLFVARAVLLASQPKQGHPVEFREPLEAVPDRSADRIDHRRSRKRNLNRRSIRSSLLLHAGDKNSNFRFCGYSCVP